MICSRCKYPKFNGVFGYVGPICQCLANPHTTPQYPERPLPYAPSPVNTGCRPFVPLTEIDVRRIVQEEISRLSFVAVKKEV